MLRANAYASSLAGLADAVVDPFWAEFRAVADRENHPFGGEVRMGPCAVVRHGGVVILLTSRRTPPSDLGQWRSQGIDPEDLFAVVAKAATEYRDAYEPITAGAYVLSLPGPCFANLGRLPFRNVRRPVYPLDVL